MQYFPEITQELASNIQTHFETAFLKDFACNWVLFCLNQSRVNLEFDLETLEQCYLMLIENAKIKKCFSSED